MLENVKFFKIKIFFTIIVIFSFNLNANEKSQITEQLNNLHSLEFTFDQLINGKNEKGSCLLQFPGMLKCQYFDDKEKITLYYPLTNSTKRRYNIVKAPIYSIFAIIFSVFVRIIHLPRMLKLRYFKGKGKQNYT